MKYILPILALALFAVMVASGCITPADIAVPVYNQIGGSVSCTDEGAYWNCPFAKGNGICYNDQMEIQIQRFRTLAGFCPESNDDIKVAFTFAGTPYAPPVEAFTCNDNLNVRPAWRQTYAYSCENGVDGYVRIYKPTAIPEDDWDSGTDTPPDSGTTTPPVNEPANIFEQIIAWIQGIIDWITGGFR